MEAVAVALAAADETPELAAGSCSIGAGSCCSLVTLHLLLRNEVTAVAEVHGESYSQVTAVGC